MTEAQKHISLHNEFQRKLIHLVAISVPVAYFFLEKYVILGLIGLGLIVALFVEWFRQKESLFSCWFNTWLGPLLRSHEKSKFTGSTYLIIGSFITVLIFPKMAAIFGLLTLVISDAFAAIIGRTYGRHYLYLNKTWEGTTTFFICTLIISIFVLKLPIWLLIGISILISVVELFLKSRFDNLIIPIVCGLCVILSRIIV